MYEIPSQRRTESGYNLVEVLIAMAMLGVVTMSVMTLFFLARGNVYSGKQMTAAVAAGNQAMEDLSAATVQGVFDMLRVNNTTTSTLGNYTIDGITYSNAIIRSTSSTVIASPPTNIAQEAPIPPATTGGILTNWRALVANMTNGSVTVILRPRNPQAPLYTATGQANCGVLQIRIIVRWQESGRQRSAVFDTVKTQRFGTP